MGYVIFHFYLYGILLDSLALDSPDLLLGSWAPPMWWHTAAFGRIDTFGANLIATGVLFLIGIVSGRIVATLFRPHERSAVLLFGATVLLSWIHYGMNLPYDAIGAVLPWSIYFWMNSVVQTLGILMGALWSSTPVFRSAFSIFWYRLE